MSTYDSSRIGRCIAWIGEQFVYEYGADRVIKFSKFDYFHRAKIAHERALQDYELCKHHFGGYLLDTEILRSENGRWVAKIQQKLTGRPLKRSDLVDPAVRSQFAEILHLYDSFASENGLIDLVGQKGLWHGTLSNIFLTQDHKLFIIDATLFGEKRYASWLAPLRYILLPLGRLLQAAYLSRYRKTVRQHSVHN